MDGYDRINERCDRLEARETLLLNTPIRELVRETLETTTNLPDHVITRATEQLAAFIEQRISAERRRK